MKKYDSLIRLFGTIVFAIIGGIVGFVCYEVGYLDGSWNILGSVVVFSVFGMFVPACIQAVIFLPVAIWHFVWFIWVVCIEDMVDAMAEDFGNIKVLFRG